MIDTEHQNERWDTGVKKCSGFSFGLGSHADVGWLKWAVCSVPTRAGERHIILSTMLYHLPPEPRVNHARSTVIGYLVEMHACLGGTT